MKPIQSFCSIPTNGNVDFVYIQERLENNCVKFYCFENKLTDEQTRKTMEEKDIIFIFSFTSTQRKLYDKKNEQYYLVEDHSCVMNLL